MVSATHAVLTNKNQQGAYRGFGAEVSSWMLERLVDMAARALGMDRVELRRRNLITADQFPYRTPTGNIYDSGNYQAVVDKLLEVSDYDRRVGLSSRPLLSDPAATPTAPRRRRPPGRSRCPLSATAR